MSRHRIASTRIHEFNTAQTASAMEQNRQIVAHIHEMGDSLFEDLFQKFGDKDYATSEERAAAVARFRKRIGYLTFTLRIKGVGGKNGNRRYALVDPEEFVRRTSELERQNIRQVEAPKYIGQVTPPRQVNVMHGGLYRPAPDACNRPGGMQFMAIASRGVRC